MWARKGSDSSKGRLDNQARKNLLEPKTQRIRPTFIGGGTTQRVGYPIYINPHLKKAYRPSKDSTNSKNLLYDKKVYLTSNNF
jgi:hypothetical protein